MNHTLPTILLIDNGSLRAEATLELRGLAAQLSVLIKREVMPVSLLHSSKVDSAELGGIRANTVKPTLKRLVNSGKRSFIFLPLFLGPSRAITDYLEQLITEARATTPDLHVVVAPTLCGEQANRPDSRLAEILVAHVHAVLSKVKLRSAKVAVIDHGTPAPAVNQLRNAVTAQVRELLGDKVAAVAACSMERREGAEYAFNEPLLENLGQLDGWPGSDLVVAMFFLLPGRHAGAQGDVAQICDGLLERKVFHSIEQTKLLGQHPLLIDLLADRLEYALQHSFDVHHNR